MPAQTAEIAAPYAGVVELVHVRIGDRVAAGQVLASLNLHTTHLDRLTAEAAQRGLEAEFRRVKLEAAQTGAHSTRLQQLFAAGLATAEELAQAESLRDISQVRLDEMAARLAEKSTQAEKMRSLEDYGAIRAPFEGSVAARFVDPGAMVAAGTALVRLVSVGDALLRFAVPEADAQAMRVGRNVVATAERGDMGPWQAVIVKAAPEIDAASRLRVVEAKVNAFTGQTDGAVFGSIVAVRLAKPPEPTP
jgi:RND family efflux transporter MFP subunit